MERGDAETARRLGCEYEAMLEAYDAEDPYDTPEYQAFVEESAKHCQCDEGVCDGVLAGGPCDQIRRGEDDGCRFLEDDE